MGVSVVALAAIAAPALAQAPGDAPAANPPTAAPTARAAPVADQQAGAGDVIVTAEHRQTNLQKVPVAVSVFTGAQRDRVGIQSVQDVTNFAPGFVYDPGNVHAYIRGVGRQSINVTDDSRVAAYEDELYVYSPYQLDKSSLFLTQEQIERGPQNVGGRNAIGGSIDMISVRPTDTPYAEVRANIGNYQTYNVEGAASGPVAPGLDLRIAGYDHNQNQGYYKNLIGPSEGNEIHEWYLEGQADWKIGSNAELFTRGFVSGWNNRGDAGSRTGYADGQFDETNLTDSNNYPGAGLFVNPNYGYAALLPGAQAGAAAAAADPTSSNFGQQLPTAATLIRPGIYDNPSIGRDNPTPSFVEAIPRTVHLAGYNGIQSTFTYHFPSFDFKDIVGEQGYNYSLNYSEPDTDVSSYTLPGSSGIPAAVAAAEGLPPPSALVINPLVDLHYSEYDHFGSNEASIQSTTNDPLQWEAGFYYYHQEYGNPITAAAPNQANFAHPVLNVTPGASNFLAPAAPNPHNYLFLQNYKISENSYAGYAQASYKINDQFKITGNFRYTEDDKGGTEFSRYVDFSSALIDGFAPIFGAATPSYDVTLGLTCPTGNGIAGKSASCYSGALAKGVKSIGTVNPNNGIESRQIGDTYGAPTGGAGIEYTPNNDIFMYARYSRGYEDFTFNAGYNSAFPEVSPEFLNSYELGYKENFGRTFTIDTALFYYDYDNFQLPIAVNNGGTIQTNFINVPKAQSTGVEIESTWTPVHDLLLTLSYSFDYTSILTGCSGTVTGGVLTPAKGALCTIDTNDPAAVEPGARPYQGQVYNATTNPGLFQSIKGSPLPDAPRNKVAVTGAYTWHFDPGALTFSATYVWRDVQDGAQFNRTYDNAPAWSDVDLRALWVGPHDKYEIIGYVKNVFNTAQYSNGPTGFGLLGNASTSTTAARGLYENSAFELVAPRTYGVEVRYKFF